MANNDLSATDVALGTAVVGLGIVHWLISILFPSQLLLLC